ncbi:MAG: phenylalanine--tRNA ligase subunit beta [Bacteroidota bacterium]
MKISLNWLKTFIDIDKTPEILEQILTGTGLEIEHYETVDSVKGGMKGLIVGHVIECVKHPNADKLNLTKVDTGSGTLLNIVCGAPNVAAGQKVIVAPVGTTVHPIKGEPFTIQKAKIRGEASEGMLCAEDEIGLGESHAGLLILPDSLAIGSSVAEYFKVSSDIVFEIGLTANRGDAASHLGVARELATVLNIATKKPAFTQKSETSHPDIKITINDTVACPRYSGVVIKGITVKDSPEWLQQRLRAIGLNSINNIVDATNFILHDLGQPLHAFDLEKIKGKQIIVKQANAGSKFTTLDGKEHTLKGHELMITNAEDEMCMAGVYGGINSGVSTTTTDIFLESAYFSADVVRKGAKTHGISTDSSFRFERGTDPEMTLTALERAVQLIVEIAGGSISHHYIDVYPTPLKPFSVVLRKASIEKNLGIQIPDATVEKILKGLEIKIVSTDSNGWQLEVPLFKSDVSREIDVIEELIRIHGFNHVPLNQHLRTSLNYKAESNERLIENKAGTLLQGMGFTEIMTNSLSSDKHYTDKTQLVYISNPLSTEMNVMRQTMLHSGLEAIAYNKNRRQHNTHFYEFGKSYRQSNGQFKEIEELVVFASGNKAAESWEVKSEKADYYFLKSAVNRLCSAFGGQTGVATIHAVDGEVLKAFDIKDDVYFAVIQWKELCKQAASLKFELQPLPQFPVVRRDLSLVLDKSIAFKSIQTEINKLRLKNLTGVNVFDVYEGKPLADDKKSISISFDLYDHEKTMADKEIDAIMQKLIQQFETSLNAVIRK